MAGLLIGCLNPNIELNPVKKVTDCLIREISTVRGVNVETQEFTYDNNGNPTKWVVKDGNNLNTWELRLFYENNKLIRIEKDTSQRDNRQLSLGIIVYKFSTHSVKNFKISSDFSEMLVERFDYRNNPPFVPPTTPRALTLSNKQKLKFKRNPDNELKFAGSEDLVNLGNIRSTSYNYDDILMSNVISKYFWEKVPTSISSVKVIKSNGFWKNVKNPFNANIWLSLIADYNTYSGYEIEGGNWSKNMQSVDPNSTFITTYETNAEGFPCRLTTKNPDFSPYPLEVRYYYNNCDCK